MQKERRNSLKIVEVPGNNKSITQKTMEETIGIRDSKKEINKYSVNKSYNNNNFTNSVGNHWMNKQSSLNVEIGNQNKDLTAF